MSQAESAAGYQDKGAAEPAARIFITRERALVPRRNGGDDASQQEWLQRTVPWAAI
jgi:hypothetical protein